MWIRSRHYVIGIRMKGSSGKDINEAVFAATNKNMEEGRLYQNVILTIACENLPNLDTFSLTDGMAILYQLKE